MLEAIDVVEGVMDKFASDFTFNDHDYERMTTWNVAAVVYCVRTWGKTDASALEFAFSSYVVHLKNHNADTSALMGQFTACLHCLGRNLIQFEIENINSAAADFRTSFDSVRQNYGMPSSEFDSYAISSFVATFEHLVKRKLIVLSKG